MSNLIRLTGVTKRYLGVPALDGVDFDMQPGEVHAVVGEKGTGQVELSPTSSQAPAG